jgi:ATP-binding cassette subfamily F protein uup
MSDPDFFKQSSDIITDASNRLQTIQSELERLLERWEELESRVQ